MTTVTPTDGATDVELGALVTARFNAPVAPSTLTSASFTLSTGGSTPLAMEVTYDAASQTAQLVGPLLPGSTYQAAVTTAVQDETGRALAMPRDWSFSTRAWRNVRVDQGSLGSLGLDALGRLHLLYSDFRDLKYATCAADCASAGNWQTVTWDHGMGPTLAVDATGRLHAGYFNIFTDEVLSEFKYATCAANCTTAANWQTVTLDQGPRIGGGSTSLALDNAGRLHLTYVNPDPGNVKYSTCAENCETAANWHTVTVHQGEAASSSIAVDETGGVHITYEDFANLAFDFHYATCPADCTVATNWHGVTIDPARQTGSSNSVVVDGAGRVHASYSALYAGLRYATCAADCTTPAGWQLGTINSGGFGHQQGHLLMDNRGRLHVSYNVAVDLHFDNESRYATCATVCTSPTNWQTTTIAHFAGAASFVLDGTGRVRISFSSGVNLWYGE